MRRNYRYKSRVSSLDKGGYPSEDRPRCCGNGAKTGLLTCICPSSTGSVIITQVEVRGFDALVQCSKASRNCVSGYMGKAGLPISGG